MYINGEDGHSCMDVYGAWSRIEMFEIHNRRKVKTTFPHKNKTLIFDSFYFFGV